MATTKEYSAMDRIETAPINLGSKGKWIRIALIILVIEKIIQHVAVTLAFYANWGDIRTTVAVNPDFLMIAGALVAILFGLSLWGLLARKLWASSLIIGLALVDIFGEFMAQGRLGITLNVSFIVAVVLLILSLVYRRQEMLR
jgi:hypothetical protein